MTSTVRWRDEGPDVVTISQGGFAFARLLSAPFL
jgi:hypothetical protein